MDYNGETGSSQIADQCDKVEKALTEQEAALNFTKMDRLDLGAHANYKTRLVQKRWQEQRS